jgi:uncharacterized protein YkwD
MKYFMLSLLAAGLLSFGFTTTHQTKTFSFSQATINSWDKEILAKANTAIHAEYLSQEEKNVILYTNLARLNGPLFAETFLSEFLQKNQVKQQKFVNSLKKDLKKSPAMAPLQSQKDLSEAAKGHAEASGKKGSLGHQNFQARTKTVLAKYRNIGENCQYGYSDGFSIVLDLLIDEGIEDLGHRKNILNPEFENIGVSIQPHKKFRFNSVMNYGGPSPKAITAN